MKNQIPKILFVLVFLCGAVSTVKQNVTHEQFQIKWHYYKITFTITHDESSFKITAYDTVNFKKCSQIIDNVFLSQNDSFKKFQNPKALFRQLNHYADKIKVQGNALSFMFYDSKQNQFKQAWIDIKNDEFDQLQLASLRIEGLQQRQRIDSLLRQLYAKEYSKKLNIYEKRINQEKSKLGNFNKKEKKNLAKLKYLIQKLKNKMKNLEQIFEDTIKEKDKTITQLKKRLEQSDLRSIQDENTVKKDGKINNEL